MMAGSSISLTDQADEVALHASGLREQIERVRINRLQKRPPEWIERNLARAEAADAAARTLRDLADGHGPQAVQI